MATNDPDVELRRLSSRDYILLACPLCLKVFKEPKELSKCPHVFCLDCLSLLIDQQDEDGKLVCPVCRTESPVPVNGVGHFKTSKSAQANIRKYGSRKQCDFCPDAGPHVQATHHCWDCDKYMCVSCRQDHLRHGPDHAVQCIQDILNRQCPVMIMRGRKCDYHPENVVSVFCEDCKIFICVGCGNDHAREKNHTIIEGTERIEKQNKIIVNLREKMGRNNSMITEYIQNVREIKEQLNQNLDTVFSDLMQVKDSLQDEIRLRSEVLIQELKDIENSSEEDLNKMKAIDSLICNSLGMSLELPILSAQERLRDDLDKLLQRREPQIHEARSRLEMWKKTPFASYRGFNDINLGHYEVISCKCIKLLKDNCMDTMVPTRDGKYMAVGRNLPRLGGIEMHSADCKLSKEVLKNVLVRGLAFLSDGRYVIRENGNKVSLFTKDLQRCEGIRFNTLPQQEENETGAIAVDMNDNIYVSYKKARKVQVFQQEGGQPVNEFRCDGQPSQMFALKSKQALLLKTGKDIIQLINMRGQVDHTISERAHGDLSAHPAVCSDDAILVAWVNHKEGLVTIEQLTSELKQMATVIPEQEIEKPERNWYSLQEFVSGELALCTPDMLYVFDKRVNNAGFK